jgi:hypothetical protein
MHEERGSYKSPCHTLSGMYKNLRHLLRSLAV